MKILAAIALATSISACAPAMIAAEIAGETYLLYVEDSGQFERLSADMPLEECQARAESLNQQTGDAEVNFVCVEESEYEVIMED